MYSPSTCLNILKMDPQLRSEEQILMLVEFLKTGALVNFSTQLPNICLKEIASVIRYKRIKGTFETKYMNSVTNLHNSFVFFLFFSQKIIPCTTKDNPLACVTL